MENVDRFRRSTNVEDHRTDELTALIRRLTLPVQQSIEDLTTHPFERPDEYYQRLYSTGPTPPATPLGESLGYNQAGNPPPLDMSGAQIQGQIVDPNKTTFGKMLLDTLNPWAKGGL